MSLSRRVYERYYNKIPNGWVIHHIDHNKNNNDINNLIAIPAVIHRGIHSLARSESRCISRVEIDEAIAMYIHATGFPDT